MTDETTGAPKRRRLVDTTPLRVSPPFARLWFGGAISGVGAQLTVVAVGLQVYDITASTLAVSLVGGIALIPLIVAGLWGGMIADAFDRKRVLIVSALVGWTSVIGLALIAWYDAGLPAGTVAVWPLYLLATLSSVSSTVQSTTRAAVTPRLIPGHLVPAASALNGISFGVQLTLGPALAGVLVAAVGYGWTYLVDILLFTTMFLGIVTLPRMAPSEGVERPGWKSLKQGVDFLRTAPNIRMSFFVDIVAMTFGRPHVLFPALGVLVFGGGPVTVGILTAAMAVGTFFASLFSGPVGQVHRHGVAIGRAITVYGGFVLLLGLTVLGMQIGLANGWVAEVGTEFSEVNPVALGIAAFAMFGMGASDEISAIFRSTMLLMASPDGMRGRLQGIFTVVVTGGPRIGDLYVGVFATAVALWFPPVLGGILIIGLIALLVRVQRGFRDYDARQPTP
ncbi:MFS transporter [Pseudolysinimonas sp.]|uniref:MFS transporter n=1 Tax=Pseudolysinimonas sp. TaxID=2680009 RepID=UPI00286BCF43|nr:MFS transporter [Pseudolysinimonas sp.]